MKSADFFKSALAACDEGSTEKLEAALYGVPVVIAGSHEEDIYSGFFNYLLRISAYNGQTELFDILLAHKNQSVVKNAASLLLTEQVATKYPVSQETLEKLAKKISDDDAVVKQTLTNAFDIVAKRPVDGNVQQAVFTALADAGAPIGTAYLAAQSDVYGEIAQLQAKLGKMGDIYSVATRTPAPPKR